MSAEHISKASDITRNFTQSCTMAILYDDTHHYEDHVALIATGSLPREVNSRYPTALEEMILIP